MLREWKWLNESALILSVLTNSDYQKVRAGLLWHTMQTNPATEPNKNIKWSKSL